MPLGAKIQALREKRGWEQVQLAQATRLSQATISRIEADEVAAVRPQTLTRLAEALGVTVDYLLGKTAQLSLREALAADPAVKELVGAYEQLPAGRRQQLLEYARFLLGRRAKRQKRP